MDNSTEENSKPQRTPGPWEVGVMEAAGINSIRDAKEHIVVSSPSFEAGVGKIRIVALCGDARAAHVNETLSDALLIAAAPDLLAALQYCVNAMNHAYGGAENFAVLEKQKAKDAIAKAKGGAA